VLLGGGAGFLVGRPVSFLASLAAVGGGFAASAVQCAIVGTGGRGAIGRIAVGMLQCFVNQELQRSGNASIHLGTDLGENFESTD